MGIGRKQSGQKPHIHAKVCFWRESERCRTYFIFFLLAKGFLDYQGSDAKWLHDLQPRKKTAPPMKGSPKVSVVSANENPPKKGKKKAVEEITTNRLHPIQVEYSYPI